MSGGLRQFLRGWGRNIGKDSRDKKMALLAQIKHIDETADSYDIDEEAWAYRYYLEDQLLQIIRMEEEYWRQRGRVRWALQGDANTAYFHAVANGRRRKCHISSLSSPSGPISGKQAIQANIYDFYRELLGTEETRWCGLAPHTWAVEA